MKMSSSKILTIIALIITISYCQFSSFVPSYLLKIPTQSITPTAIVQPLDNYISFKQPPSFKSIFGIASTQAQSTAIRNSVCIFPFVLLEGACQCPRFTKYLFGKCIGAVPEDYNGNKITPEGNGGTGTNPDNNSGGTVVGQIQCPLLKINIKKKTGYIEDLAYISRTYDGTKNNKNFADWGSAGSLLQRRISANYIDGISQPINHLPSPRIVSNTIGSQNNPIKTSRLNVTIAFTIFGQFVDHDLDLTGAQPGSGQSMNIPIPPNDLFFTNQQYIKFTRSQFVSLPNQPRRHKNLITSWIDGSQIYGSDNDTNCALRTYKKGKLKVSTQNGKQQFLPLLNSFFRAGDVRAIENSILVTYHTIFLRQHNRICDEVLAKNPKFNDETVFQIARNYVIGLLQKIILKDFVKLLLGDNYVNLIGQYNGYNPNINPNIPTQFSTASYRIGHTLLVNKIPSIKKNGNKQKQYSLNELFFKQDIVTTNFIGNILRGASRTLTKEKSSQLVDDVRNLLVLDPTNREVKLDLFSLNIQRGRDHGLPTYNDAREAFGLSRIKTFEEIIPITQIGVAKKLKTVYGSPDNIQLFVGIISQRPLKGAILGQLGAQIVGQTFRNLRDGDRFWYENVFPSSVIKQIDNTQLGDICARNSAASDLPSNIFTYNSY